MTKTHNTQKLRSQLEMLAESAFIKNKGYVVVKVAVLDELLDTSEAYDDLVRDLVEAVRR